MANIMITYRCNLQCPYCFANEFVNKSYTDMTMEDFIQTVDFLAQTPGTRIGMIGGEPTVHPLFEDMIIYLSKHPNVASIMIYTNGLLLDKYAEFLVRPDIQPMVKILVNCNSPKVLGERGFEHLIHNLDLLYGKYRMGQNIKLGINLYDNDFDYSYIKELLVRYDLYQIRISLTVPDFSNCGSIQVLKHFEERKEYLLNFYREMEEIGVLAYYDCNRPPKCIFTEKEWAWICWYRNKYHALPSNIADENTKCSPVIDILPNKKAVRCFGMSDFEKVDIESFDSVDDIVNHYRNEVDYGAYKIASAIACEECYLRKVQKCTGGCIGFKYTQILDVNRYIREKYNI